MVEKAKHYKITQMYKSGNKKDIENYRSVSIMCAPPKIFEQIMYIKIYNHVKNSIVDE